MLTKRYVSPGGEEKLYQPIQLQHGSIVLSDYMGGDPTIELAATCGLGREVIAQNMTSQQFLNQLVRRRLFNPFKFVQVQFIIQSPIDVALQFVYQPRCSVNEYSLRYSEALDSSFTPTLEELTSQGISPESANSFINAFQNIRTLSYETYLKLINQRFDLSRELSRTILGSDQDTKFCWKMDLYSLSEFVKSQRAIANPLSKEFVDAIENLALKIAPLSWRALMCKTIRKKELFYPKDSEIVDPDFSINFVSQETKRPVAEGLETLLFSSRSFLDHGLFFPFDYMGNDSSIASAARTSYGQGTRSVSDDQVLIRYLFRHNHTSPFEMPELAFFLRAPFFSDPRQLGRHRTLDFNSFLDRYPKSSFFYIPEDSELKAQSSANRQGRSLVLDPNKIPLIKNLLTTAFQSQRDMPLPGDLTRILKGVGHYTKLARTGDLRNLLHMLSLRLDPHAQYEVRTVAHLIAESVKLQCSAAYSAFEDYQLNAVRLSAIEIKILKGLVKPYNTPERFILNDVRNAAIETIPNQRERTEFVDKLKKNFGLIDMV